MLLVLFSWKPIEAGIDDISRYIFFSGEEPGMGSDDPCWLAGLLLVNNPGGSQLQTDFESVKAENRQVWPFAYGILLQLRDDLFHIVNLIKISGHLENRSVSTNSFGLIEMKIAGNGSDQLFSNGKVWGLNVFLTPERDQVLL